MVETLTYTYTSEAEMTRWFSSQGMDLRLDDLVDDADTIQDCINWATDFVNQYVLVLYEADSLAESLWVRGKATVIACWMLSQRRGDPELFTSWVDEIKEELERVRTGDIIIPRLGLRSWIGPTMSAPTIQPYTGSSAILVNPIQSFGPIYSTQHSLLYSYHFPFLWL